MKSGASVGKVVAGSLVVFVVLLLAKSRGYVDIGHKAEKRNNGDPATNG